MGFFIYLNLIEDTLYLYYITVHIHKNYVEFKAVSRFRLRKSVGFILI